MQAGFKLNPGLLKEWRKAVRELAGVAGKSDPEGLQKLVMLSARRFVKNVADITPPSQGEANKESKTRGEEAIVTDLYKIALPVVGEKVTRRQAKEIYASAEELLAVHERARRGAAGRVNPRSRKEKLLVKQLVFNQVLKRLQGMVGFLAAGLNAAAERLGIRLTPWIARHGARYGKIEVIASNVGLKVRIVQDTPYTDAVKGYARQWNFALRKEVNSLINQAKKIVRRRAKRAGFKIR